MAGESQLDALQGGHKVGKLVTASKGITNGNWKLFVPQEDTVIASFVATDDSNQMTAWNIGTETIKAGTVLFAQDLKGIKTLTLTSGSGFVYDSL